MYVRGMRLLAKCMVKKDKILTFYNMHLAKEDLELKRKVKFYLSIAHGCPKQTNLAIRGQAHDSKR